MSKQRAGNPLVMLSHCGGASRLLYTTISEELARLGYIVAAIDHPYDTLIVEFPDGHIVKGGSEEIDRDLIKLLVKTRAQDVSFVIDELGRPSSKHPFEMNTTDVIAFGHSLGGASVAEAALKDTRIKGGINVDGRLFGSLERPNTTLSKSFIQFQSEESAHGPPWNWDEEWQHLSGWKIQLLLEGAQHATFTDMPLVIEALGLRKRWGRRGEEILGKLDGRKRRRPFSRSQSR
jgi:dienelactone hydrolase